MAQKYAAYSPSGAITAFYDAVDSPPPSGVTTLAISDAEWKACLAAPGTTVAAGALVPPAPPTSAQLLASAQAARTKALSAACRAAIVSGFSSAALGAAHSYPSMPPDQQNLADAMSASLAPGLADNWTALLWCASGTAWALTAHTAAQVRQAHADWIAFRQAQQTKLATLAASVATATSPQAVAAVVWT